MLMSVRASWREPLEGQRKLSLKGWFGRPFCSVQVSVWRWPVSILCHFLGKVFRSFCWCRCGRATAHQTRPDYLFFQRSLRNWLELLRTRRDKETLMELKQRFPHVNVLARVVMAFAETYRTTVVRKPPNTLVQSPRISPKPPNTEVTSLWRNVKEDTL